MQGCKKITEWRKLLFSLCLFHGVTQERRTFGPLGWNIPYEFNDSDLRISLMQLQMFLNDYEEVPFEALMYLIGECNYGGRVTDDKDRRLLVSLLGIYLNEEIISAEEYSYSPTIKLPKDVDYQGCLNYIQSLSISQPPETFGLHQNADIAKDNAETTLLLEGALLAQSQLGKMIFFLFFYSMDVIRGFLCVGQATGAEKSNDQIVFELASEILEKMPDDEFDVEDVSSRYPVVYQNSMNTVLRQELIRCNRLTEVIKSGLRNLKRAIKGQIVMSSSLEEIFHSMCLGRVPESWKKKSYPTLKPLNSYINDLLQRIVFFQEWIDNDAPNVFWISGFFFTQSFLTGVLQNYARRLTIPIDRLDFEFDITRLVFFFFCIWNCFGMKFLYRGFSQKRRCVCCTNCMKIF